MLFPSQFSPQAWDDMRDIVAYIASDNPEAASRFVPALEATYTHPRFGHFCKPLEINGLHWA